MPDAKYYAEHREEIRAKKKEKKDWLKYYEQNRDKKCEQARLRYYAKTGRTPPPLKKEREIAGSGVADIAMIKDETTHEVVSKDDSKVKVATALLEQLRELLPGLIKPPSRTKHRYFIAGVPIDPSKLQSGST